jgi:serine/threonine protein phosphatase 1
MSRSAKVALPRPPPGRRFYAVGDIHGRLDLLRELLALIRSDYLENPNEQAELIFLGDYIDRGPDSAAVIAFLIALGEDSPGLAPVFLKGNHEGLMQEFLAGGPRSYAWLHNGGDATLASYGVAPARPERDGMDEAREALAAALPDSHRRFFAALAPYFRADPYLFVHAGIRPGVALERQDEDDLLWIRRPFLDSVGKLPHFVVHGHSITVAPELRPYRLGIDTGAFFTGLLTAAVIDETGVRFLDTRRV